MRILAIRGENLTSLATPFSIDLTAAPLAGTGLFAITGETGAGKSTILDALCLALYGNYPRLDCKGDEKAPDPSGHDLSAKDARAILRRGAGGGWAQVDFVGQDGHAYRVRWEALRARGRANGRLQEERRLLTRLDGTPVAEGKTNVQAKVEALTDLKFGQFRRTVLLAQGEFDAFLLAAENERAELLEKVTGTEIYAVISQRVHSGTAARDSAVKQIEARRAGIGLLDEAARGALVEERGGLVSEAAERAGEREALGRRLDRQARLVETRAKLAAAEADRDLAAGAVAQSAAERTEWAELDRIEPLRAKAEAVDAAELARGHAETERLGAAAALCEAEGTAATAAEGLDTAKGADSREEERFKRFGPLWSEAERLDAEIAGATAELVRARKTATAAEDAWRARADALVRLEADHAATKEAQEDARARLQAQAAYAPLAERADEIAGLLDKRRTLRQSWREASAKLITIEHDIARLRTILNEVAAKSDAKQALRARIAGQIETRCAALAAIGEEALEERDADLRAFLDRLGEALAPLRMHGEAELALGRAEGEAKDADAAAGQARAALAEAEAAHASYAAARAGIVGRVDLAEATASAEAADLRSRLVEGEPCPVCGARDHPAAGAADAGGVFAAAIKQRRAELDAAIAAAESSLIQAKGLLASAMAEGTAATRLAADARAQRAASAAAYAALKGPLERARANCGLAGAMPPGAGTGTLRLAAELKVQADAVRLGLAEPLRAAKRLRKDLDRLRHSHAGETKALDQLASEAASHAPILQAAKVEAAQLAANGAQWRERLDSIERQLAPFLAAAAMTLADLDRNAAAGSKRLRTLGDAHRLLLERVAGLDAALGALEPRLAAERGACETSHQANETAARELRRRETWLTAKRDARLALLGGEDTGTHRTRLNEARKAARAALDAAQMALTAAVAALASARARHQAAAAASAGSADRLAGALGLFAAGCQCAEVSAERARALLAEPAERRDSLRRHLDGLEGALADADRRLAERQADLAQRVAAGAEEIDTASVEAALRAAGARLDIIHQRLGAITQSLRHDDEARAKAESLTGEIAAAKADLDVWRDVDEAIGSAKGDKFRRFAQGITLDQLVALANDRLADLAPRYRLERAPAADLSLHVVDRDMGEERRAPRSLSGGERFLVSLALALALSGLEGRQSFVDTLFIDEGFGSLDADMLDIAIDALECLHGHGRKVGVITHVGAMIERIAVQIRVEKRGNGRSEVRVLDRFDERPGQPPALAAVA